LPLSQHLFGFGNPLPARFLLLGIASPDLASNISEALAIYDLKNKLVSLV